MIYVEADDHKHINQKSNRRIARSDPSKVAESNIRASDRRKEEAERGRNDKIRCHMHVPEVKNFSESKRHLEIQYYRGLRNTLILLDFLRFAFFPMSQNFQN